MTESERDLGRRWFELVWNQGRREAIGEMLSSEALIHDGSVDTRGADGFYIFFDRIHKAYSDVHVAVEDIIAEADRLCVRWTFTARHTGDGLGINPTGKGVTVTGITILRIAEGKIVEGWQNWDMLGMLHQTQGAGSRATYVGEPGG